MRGGGGERPAGKRTNFLLRSMFSMQHTSTQLRTCSKCGMSKPLTSEHFQIDSQKSSGFRPDCKACRHASYARKNENSRRVKNKSLLSAGMKMCCACNAIKQIGEFHRRGSDRLIDRCKPCVAEYVRTRRLMDPKSFDAPAKAYKSRNKEKVRERARVYMSERRVKNPQARFRESVGRLVGGFLKRRGKSKAGKSFFDSIGYSPFDLIKHIEAQFTKGMTWENYGEWHLDHIIPNSSFNYLSMDDKEFSACWALSNLRPLWGHENMVKGDSITLLL